jgi:hypothetical protein
MSVRRTYLVVAKVTERLISQGASQECDMERFDLRKLNLIECDKLCVRNLGKLRQ